MMDTARLRQLSRLFEEAEQRIALAQCRADCEIPVRCVEEKSRASHHLFRYAASNAKADADEVVRCCERAIFDACEFEILSYSRKFMRFQERYRTVPISMIVPDYLSWRT